MNSKFFYFLFFSISFINAIKLNDNDFFEKMERNLVRKIDRISKNMDDKYIMERMIDKFETYIYSRDIKREGINRDDFKKLKKKRNETATHMPDGTYDLNTKQPISFDRGYQASFEILYDTYEDEIYDMLCYKLALMTDNNVYLGVFNGNPEISFHFEDIELANTIAILFDQISIWDWSISDVIKNPYCDRDEE